MVERRAAKVTADVKLRLARAVGGNVVGDDLKPDDKNIQPDKAPDTLHGLVCDKMVDGILLEQRYRHIRAACHKPHENHPEQEASVYFQIRIQLRDAEPRQSLVHLLFHAVSSSPMDICMS